MSTQRLISTSLVLLAAACSSGGGISGTGNMSSGFAFGPIDGFGSVIVNGVRFETSAATFTAEGVPATQADFAIGQVVEVQGDFATGVATSVTYRSEIKGPVTSSTVTDPLLGLGTFVVLGQTVRANAQTVYSGTTLELIGVNDLLEVSGPRNADGSVVATYIEAKAVLPEYKVVGVAENATATTFTIGGLNVDYSSADTSGLPGGLVDAGDRVEARTAPAGFAAPSTFVADRVELANRPGIGAGVRIELEGFVTDFVSPGSFNVLGIPVRTTAATVFVNGSVASLANGVKVEVEGNTDGNGVLVAESCEIESTGAIRTEWEIEAIDLANSTVTVLGIQWQIRSTTELEDDSDAEVDPLNLTDLLIGDTVQVRGFRDGSSLIASRLERDDPQSDAELRGPVTAVTPGGTFDFEILGVGIRSDGSTVHRDENEEVITQADFLSRLSSGVFVEAEWDPFMGTAGAADELSLELDD